MSNLQRKIQSKGSASGRNTPTSSRPSSRAGTDEEWASEDNFSIASNDTADSLWNGASSALEVKKEWREDIQNIIEGLVQRKGSNVAGREELLVKFIRLASLRYAEPYLDHSADELIGSTLRMIRGYKAEREAVLSAKALAIIAITIPEHPTLTSAVSQVQNAIEDTPFLPAKAALLYTLGILAYFKLMDMTGMIEFFVEIVENDGYNIAAGDDEAVVAAAMDSLSFVASSIDPSSINEITELAMPALVNQLESSDVSVRISAGEAIAVLFSIHADQNEEEEGEEGEAEGEDKNGENTNFVEKNGIKKESGVRNGAYDDIPRLTQLLSELSTQSGKRLPKQHRQKQHSAFRDILATVNEPRSSLPSFILRFQRRNLAIDSWVKLTRLQMLRRVLTHGLHVHILQNPAVQDLVEFEGGIVGGDGSDADDGGEPLVSTEEKRIIYKELRRLRQGKRREGRRERMMQLGNDEDEDE